MKCALHKYDELDLEKNNDLIVTNGQFVFLEDGGSLGLFRAIDSEADIYAVKCKNDVLYALLSKISEIVRNVLLSNIKKSWMLLTNDYKPVCRYEDSHPAYELHIRNNFAKLVLFSALISDINDYMLNLLAEVLAEVTTPAAS